RPRARRREASRGPESAGLAQPLSQSRASVSDDLRGWSLPSGPRQGRPSGGRPSGLLADHGSRHVGGEGLSRGGTDRRAAPKCRSATWQWRRRGVLRGPRVCQSTTQDEELVLGKAEEEEEEGEEFWGRRRALFCRRGAQRQGAQRSRAAARRLLTGGPASARGRTFLLHVDDVAMDSRRLISPDGNNTSSPYMYLVLRQKAPSGSVARSLLAVLPRIPALGQVQATS
ncbi:unnamed protein product, partial [Prorocentrum cordatum]